MTINEINELLTDEAILAEVGARIARRRLEMQLTQAQVAEQAGVAKRTVERIESGGSSQMSSMIRIFRVLELLAGLEQLVPRSTPGPMAQLQGKGRLRQRASGSRRTVEPEEPWTWGEDE
ncbi:MAG: helix-turn-helix transcriptional regulator [bacterium]|nr:helix-turn-helix transcriptional regulator [bacterium]